MKKITSNSIFLLTLVSFSFLSLFSGGSSGCGGGSSSDSGSAGTSGSSGSSGAAGGASGSGGSAGGSGNSGGTAGTFGSATAFSSAGLVAASTSWSSGSPPDLSGYRPFLQNNEWYRDISTATVDSDSTNIIADIQRDEGGTTLTLHPDFGSSTFEGNPVGIPYDVVAGSSASKVNVTIGSNGYPHESDPPTASESERVPLPVPLPSTAHIEGGNDHHILLLDKDNFWLYELYHVVHSGSSWQADQVTVWDLNDNTKRPFTWTSADQAGLSIFAGLVRYDDVQNAIASSGDLGHAIRVTVNSTREPFIPPANHPGGGNDPTAHSPQMGMRFRLKSSWLTANIGNYSAQNKVILRTLAKYGMIVADTGSNFLISGTQDARWVEDADAGGIAQLSNVPATAFEAIAHTIEYDYRTAPTGNTPTISSFTATPLTISRGSSTTLTWSTSNASTTFITPSVGPVRGTSISVSPTSTTTYTLYTTNEYGRSVQTVTVTVN